MLIPFVGQSYTQASLNVNAQRTVNFYLEMSPDGKTPLAMFPRPGLVDFATCGTAIRGGAVFNGVGYAVSGNKFYTVTSGGTVTERGTLDTSSGRVYFAFNGVQVMVTDGSAGYIFTLATNGFAKITDVDYDAFGPVTFIDGWFVASVPDSGTMANSNLNDGTAWDALDFATASSSPDNLVRVIAHQNELVVFGDKTIEFWYNDAGTNFPFSRYIGAEIDIGLETAASLVELADEGLFFLATDGVVYNLRGRQPTRISTHAIETALRGYSSVSGAYAYPIEWDGHKFYCLTIPSETTWVFDISNGSWVEWSSWEGDPFSPVFGITLGRNQVVGAGTKLYTLDADAYDDDGTTIERIRDTQTISDDQKPLFFARLELMMETGVGTLSVTDPQVMLSWSDNGGHTFGSEVYGAAGASGAGDIGEYARRVYWNRLGQSRNRIWRVRMTDAVKWVIQGASAEITRGAY